MKAVILAGGMGTRLGEATQELPKPMVTVGGRPILWHIMKIFHHHGISEFVICLGYKGHVIKQFFANYALLNSNATVFTSTGSIEFHDDPREDWKVTLVDTGDATMTGGRLLRAREFIGAETFLMTYGDGVANVDISALIDFHRSHGKRSTVTAVQPPGRFGALTLVGNSVRGFSEKLDNRDQRVSGGFFVLEPDVLDLVTGDDCVWEAEPMTSLAKSAELEAYRHDGFWQPMDTPRDRRLLQRLWSETSPPWKVWE